MKSDTIIKIGICHNAQLWLLPQPQQTEQIQFEEFCGKNQVVLNFEVYYISSLSEVLFATLFLTMKKREPFIDCLS